MYAMIRRYNYKGITKLTPPRIDRRPRVTHVTAGVAAWNNRVP